MDGKDGLDNVRLTMFERHINNVMCNVLDFFLFVISKMMTMVLC